MLVFTSDALNHCMSLKVHFKQLSDALHTSLRPLHVSKRKKQEPLAQVTWTFVAGRFVSTPVMRSFQLETFR